LSAPRHGEINPEAGAQAKEEKLAMRDAETHDVEADDAWDATEVCGYGDRVLYLRRLRALLAFGGGRPGRSSDEPGAGP
jgi:hypothetical protein